MGVKRVSRFLTAILRRLQTLPEVRRAPHPLKINMEIQTLKNNLLESYSAANLNLISVVLINLYKNQQFGTLQKIAEIISDFVQVEIDENGKGFSKLMLLYHPDRGEFHRIEIIKLAEFGSFDALLNYSHILKLERIEEMASALESLEDIDYSPVYAWDFDDYGFTIKSDSGQKQKSGNLNNRKNKPVTFTKPLKSVSTEIQKSVFRPGISKISMSLNLLNQTLTTSTAFSIAFMQSTSICRIISSATCVCSKTSE
jgi:hypothetical protein